MLRPYNLATYVCQHVFENTRPVLLVVHDEGDWVFMCGKRDHGDDCRTVGVGHLRERDPTLDALSDLPLGCEAERAAVGEAWIRRSLDGQDDC